MNKAIEIWNSLDLNNQADLECARAWFIEGFAHGQEAKELDEDFDAVCLENKSLQAEIELLETELVVKDVFLKSSIPLTKAEIESGLSRVKWAELLIKQLPEEHEGRNSWLLNYGSEK
jgi:hypothetical protein